MSKPRFTRGYWYVTLTPYMIACRGPLGVMRKIASTIPDNCGTGLDVVEITANARLISAAPEMYEALRYLLVQGEAQGMSEFMLADARKAVAKAEGKTS